MNNKDKYTGMGIFQEAKQRGIDGMGYRATRQRIIRLSKECSWNIIRLSWGIRWSDEFQVFPIWNMSHNCDRSLLFGFWKLYFQVSYSRKGTFNHNRPFISNRWVRKFYQLVA
jgi:hypothetical protein